MRVLAWCPILVLLSACQSELPTDPSAPMHAVTNASAPCTNAGAFVEPQTLVMRPGATTEIVVRVCYPPAALPWSISVYPPSVADGRATIEMGASYTRLPVHAKAPGVARVSYTVPNFGRAPSTRVIGSVVVTSGTRRRSVAR